MHYKLDMSQNTDILVFSEVKLYCNRFHTKVLMVLPNKYYYLILSVEQNFTVNLCGVINIYNLNQIIRIVFYYKARTIHF